MLEAEVARHHHNHPLRHHQYQHRNLWEDHNSILYLQQRLTIAVQQRRQLQRLPIITNSSNNNTTSNSNNSTPQNALTASAAKTPVATPVASAKSNATPPRRPAAPNAQIAR